MKGEDMGEPMNYDVYAAQYASTRWAVPWIVSVLAGQVRAKAPDATVLEIGCGTGNYIIALSEMFPTCVCKGFDLSSEMQAVARSRSEKVQFLLGDAETQFPCAAREVDFAFLVDVVHHLRNLNNLFRETVRILRPGGLLMIVTDSQADLRNRSLTRFFPEILEIQLKRYPPIAVLNAAAERAGLRCDGQEPAEGDITLTDAFIAKLEQKCASSLRLISPQAHQAGVDRVREARRLGEQWHSCYTAMRYSKRVEEPRDRPDPPTGTVLDNEMDRGQ